MPCPPRRQRACPRAPRGWPCWRHGCCMAWCWAGRCWASTPRFGFAPALSMTAWLVLTVYAVERELFPQLQARWALAGLGAAAVLLALVFPGTPLHVSASPWLPLHWALGIACYGLFAVAVVHAWLMTPRGKADPPGLRPACRPAAAHAGAPHFPLRRRRLRAAVGHACWPAWLFGDTFYGPGRGWRWDHKTVFSVLAWLVFAGAAAGPRALRLARPQGGARAVCGRAAAAAGLRRVALRARSGAGAHGMKFLVLIAVLVVVSLLWRSKQRRAQGRRRGAPPRRRRCRRTWCAARSARCTCRAPTRCPRATGCSIAAPSTAKSARGMMAGPPSIAPWAELAADLSTDAAAGLGLRAAVARFRDGPRRDRRRRCFCCWSGAHARAAAAGQPLAGRRCARPTWGPRWRCGCSSMPLPPGRLSIRNGSPPSASTCWRFRRCSSCRPAASTTRRCSPCRCSWRRCWARCCWRFGTAAAVTLLLLTEAWLLGLQLPADSAPRLLQAALTGAGYFALAFLANQLAARLAREEQTARRSQKAARMQAQVNELVIETLADGVLVVDPRGEVLAANPAARLLLGCGEAAQARPFAPAGAAGVAAADGTGADHFRAARRAGR